TDRRALYVELTDEGHALIDGVFPDHAAVVEAAMAGLTQEEQRTMTALLKRLGQHAQDQP
ncbi:MAG TPA: hypothetical protein VF092_28515, partial [Longimicrobium sp.]